MTHLPQKRSFESRLRYGFSLVEMLIVIALIAIVGTLVINQLGGTYEEANKDVAQQFVNQSLKAPLLKYRIDTGSYPSAEDGGLMALLNAPPSKQAQWKGPYIETLPPDPWQRPYQYRYPGVKNPSGYDLWSQGPDPQSDADDIGNW